MRRPEVVVTGLGAITPLGVGAEALHGGWLAGRTGFADGVAPCADFDPADFLSRKDARRADRFTQVALAAAAEAIAQADLGELERERLGCIVGTGIGGLSTIEENYGVYLDRGGERVSPLAVPLMMSNAAPAAVSMRHDLRGPVFGVVSACAAGAHAIGMAMRTIQFGDADVIVTGGAEAAITPMALAAFRALDALSDTGESRPFDLRRDGFVMGEGAGILVLESRAHAEARGATILGTLSGYASTGDAHHLTAPREDGEQAAKAMTAALADARREPSDVAYVNAHGTSTPMNDAAETAAIKRALGSLAAAVPVSSTKSAIGHLLGAAGAVEAVATILALRDRVAPPTLGWAQRDPVLDLDYVPDTARPLAAERPVALSNSFGFGGHNVVLCMESA
ncbi:MAG: beta-ketoacyl-ACP synthase II [Patulibacter sp.]|nr:beta-ketoacyl-ACP synthase II [Patulibacter sp.]